MGKSIASGALLLLALAGCATSGQTGLVDFNSRFKENIPASPQYKIENAGSNRYQILVYQGSAVVSERTTRAGFLTRAAMISMDAHCAGQGKQLGEHQFRDDSDSMGYVNVLGFFSCKA